MMYNKFLIGERMSKLQPQIHYWLNFEKFGLHNF